MNIKANAASTALALAFSLLAIPSFAADKTAPAAAKNDSSKARVTGIGGVFFKAKKDHKALAEWYQKNLGITLEPWGGSIMKWTDENRAPDGGVTVWHAQEKDSKVFAPSSSSFMINYRIDNMDKMVKQLKANGVAIQKGPQSDENGKFLWVMDPDGNKVELWQPMVWDEKNKKR